MLQDPREIAPGAGQTGEARALSAVMLQDLRQVFLAPPSPPSRSRDLARDRTPRGHMPRYVTSR